MLSTLDEALWSYDAASLIPQQRLLHATISEPKDASKSVQENNEALAPVLLSSYMPADFKGIVLNTTIHPVNRFMAATNNAQPTRVLELIKPDPESTQEGRHKYKAYQQLGYELTHFKV